MATDLGEAGGDGCLRRWVVDDHPPVAFEVATHGRVTGEFDAVQQHVTLHGPGEVQPLAHLLGGGEETIHLVEIEPCYSASTMKWGWP